MAPLPAALPALLLTLLALAVTEAADQAGTGAVTGAEVVTAADGLVAGAVAENGVVTGAVTGPVAGAVFGAEVEAEDRAGAGVEAASAALGIRKPLCDRQDACFCESMPAGSFKLFCAHALDYTFRFTYVAPTSPQSGASIVIWCQLPSMERQHYEQLFTYDMQLGAVDTVMFNLCPLPSGRLVDFLGRLGVDSLERLNVYSHSIINDTMPADFLEGINATSVRLIDVSHIQLHDDFLSSLGQLQNLTMTGGALQLPPALFRHTPRLGQLGLTNSQLRSLPDGLFDGLTRLTQLVLGKNRLQQLTRRHFRDLGRLEWLDLYVNQLETLPHDVFAPLRSLQTLRMEDNPLRSLPEGLFAGTRELRLLRLNGGLLRGGRLRQLPPGLFHGLAKLDMLMLHQLGLEELPDTLFANLTALANLTLDRNRLETLPETVLADLSNLRNLDLRGNRLTRLPPRLLQGLHQMDSLYLSSNGLSELPDDMFVYTPQLERLFIKYNNLTRLTPRKLPGPRNELRLLQLDGNQLTLDGEPFKQLPQLRELHLARNRIDRITQDLLFNLMHLKRLDLSNNLLQNITFKDLNFLCTGAEIDLSRNRIASISLEPAHVVQVAVSGNDAREPNRIVLKDNPLHCDCNLVSLRNYVDGVGPLAQQPARKKLDELFSLDMSQLACAGPPPLAGQRFDRITSGKLMCPVQDECPSGCRCSNQPSTNTVLVTCDALPAGEPLPTVLPDEKGKGISMHLENTGLRRLTDLSNTSVAITELHLSHNNLTNVSAAYLPPMLRVLRLDHNNLTGVSPSLLAYLDRSGANVSLGNNPYECNCDLVPLHTFLVVHVANNSNPVLDAADVRCVGQANLTLIEMAKGDVCPPRRLAMVIAACVAATALAMCALVTAVIYYNYGDTIKVWLYSRGLCLALVSEEELDTDKKYDAFVSYSHLDEEFVVEQLVPELERGEPKYTLCLHFRDWLAGEWITDQIQRSVQESRRVIVVMSNNFIQSEWGRLEFLAAHKQALSDKRNRVILVVYGPLPEPAAMEPELRAYISLNTYLQWGDPLFWQRLRYALPHGGGRRPSKSARRRRLTSDKLGLILRDGGLSSAGSTPAGTPTVEMPATPPAGHLNGCFVGDKLGTISESRLREQHAEHAPDNAV